MINGAKMWTSGAEFADYVWLLITGGLPSQGQRQVVITTLVAIAEHGFVPSVQAARMTLAAAPEALQGAVATVRSRPRRRRS